MKLTRIAVLNKVQVMLIEIETFYKQANPTKAQVFLQLDKTTASLHKLAAALKED